MTVQNPRLITSVWMFVTCPIPSEDFKTLHSVPEVFFLLQMLCYGDRLHPDLFQKLVFFVLELPGSDLGN